MSHGFEQRDERVLLDIGRGISVRELTLVAPDGSTAQRQAIRHPGAVCVVPIVADGVAVLVRQYRAALDALVLEIPAGLRDVAGEPTDVTAQRELGEEIGFRAGRLELLTVFNAIVGLSDEAISVYLGTELSPVPLDRHGPEEQAMTIEHVRLDDVPAMVADGRITDGKTIVGLLLAREHLRA